MATTKYNPYNAVKSISDLKGKYHTAKELGKDYGQYATQATQYYNELKNNGYGDVADELTANDYIGSLDILSRYKPDTDFEIDTVYNDLMDSMGGKTSGSFSDNVSKTTSDDILDRLYDSGWQKQYSDLMDKASGIASGEIKPGTSDAVQQILDSFSGTDKLLNGDLKYDANGNAIGGLNIDHYNTGKNQLDFLNNFDYTAQSYFDPIMESFKLKGSDAAKGELASGAASNGGNIDSYAAANANRQQLAFTTAGHEAARAAAQQNQDNWQRLYDAMSGNLSDMGAINSQNLATGAGMYTTDSTERQNALNQATGMANDEAARRINAYLSKLSDENTRYNIDAGVAMNRENNAANMAQTEVANKLQQYLAELTDNTTRYQTDKNIAATAAENEAAREFEKFLTELGYTKSAEQAEREHGYAKDLAGMNNQYQKDIADINAKAQNYAVDKQYDQKLYTLQQENELLKEQNKTAANNDKSTIKDGVITFSDGSQYTYDQVINEIYLGVLYGDSAFSDINSESDFKAAAISSGIPAETVEKYIASLRKTYGDNLSDLFELADTARKANKVK